MKRLVVIILTLNLTTIMLAQNYNGEDLKHCLSQYRNDFTSMLSRIDSLRTYFSDLDAKLKNNPDADKLSKRICHNYYKSREFGVLRKQLQDLENLLKAASSQVTPITENRDLPEQPPVEQPREPRVSIEQPPVEDVHERREPQEIPITPRPDNRRERIEQYLGSFSLSGLCDKGVGKLNAKRQEVIGRLRAYGDQTLCDAYVAIFNLLNVQYVIYNRTIVKDAIQNASSIDKDVLVGSHYSELQAEIAHVKEYRYATMELQRLIKIVANPSNAIRKELGYDNSGAGDSKWADSVEKEIPANEIRDYLIGKNETEYISKFEYTNQKFNDFVDYPDQRKVIMDEIDNALK